jgi:IS1 family transposase
MRYRWRDLQVIECPLDERWSVVQTTPHHAPLARLYDETYGDAWVWVAFAPVWRLVRAFGIGKRTQKRADLLLERVLHVTDAHLPYFTSDQ